MSHPDNRVEQLLKLFPPPPSTHPAIGEVWEETAGTSRSPIEPKPWWRRLLSKGTLR